MFFRHYTELNLCKISDFMEYFSTDKPGYGWCDYVVSRLQIQFDTTLTNKGQISPSLSHLPDNIPCKLNMYEFGFECEYVMQESAAAFRKVYTFSFVLMHIHKCMSLLPCTARSCQQGQGPVNKYYRSTCFDEGAADWGINNISRPFFKDQFTDHGGWDIIPLFSLKICKLPSDKLAFPKKQRENVPLFLWE